MANERERDKQKKKKQAEKKLISKNTTIEQWLNCQINVICCYGYTILTTLNSIKIVVSVKLNQTNKQTNTRLSRSNES